MEELKKLIEARQIEAARKKLPEKLICVAKYLGQPMYGMAGGLEYNEFDWEIYEEIPTADDIDYEPYGYFFYALSFGHNFEIKYNHEEHNLKVKYNCISVFSEVDGQLTGYFPSPLWEDLVENYYKIAKEKEEIKTKANKLAEKEGFLKQASKFMQKVRETWGI